MRGLLIWITAVATILGFALGPSIVEGLRGPVDSGELRVAMLHYGPIVDSGWTPTSCPGKTRVSSGSTMRTL